MAGHSTVVHILNGLDIEWPVTGQMDDSILGNVWILDFDCIIFPMEEVFGQTQKGCTLNV